MPGNLELEVLIIEDNHDAADSLRVLLQLLGHRAHVEYDGETGLLAATALQPDIIFLDIGLPRQSGYDVAEKLRAQSFDKPLRIIALTGWSKETARARAAEVGIDEYLIKPVELAQLQQILDTPD